MTQTFNLTGGSPWGFRLVGGTDFRAQLTISKVRRFVSGLSGFPFINYHIFLFRGV